MVVTVCRGSVRQAQLKDAKQEIRRLEKLCYTKGRSQRPAAPRRQPTPQKKNMQHRTPRTYRVRATGLLVTSPTKKCSCLGNRRTTNNTIINSIIITNSFPHRTHTLQRKQKQQRLVATVNVWIDCVCANAQSVRITCGRHTYLIAARLFLRVHLRVHLPVCVPVGRAIGRENDPLANEEQKASPVRRRGGAYLGRTTSVSFSYMQVHVRARVRVRVSYACAVCASLTGFVGRCVHVRSLHSGALGQAPPSA